MVKGIRWIIANRRQPTGAMWSMRSLSMAAGLAASHLEQIVNGRQDADMVELRVLRSVAKAADVSLAWLVTHDGVPGTFRPVVVDVEKMVESVVERKLLEMGNPRAPFELPHKGIPEAEPERKRGRR